MSGKIVLGTRGSELARTQARFVEEAIRNAWPDLRIETEIIATRGDKPQAVNRRAGWKGLFTAEIERALVAGEIDLAVHSAKDLPSQTSAGTQIAAALPRAPVNDVLVSKHSGGLATLPKHAIVATSSVRRKHQLLWQRPHLSVVALRGNVPTRLRKLEQNNWDAIVLARAGLERLGILLDTSTWFFETLPTETFLPAGGQGVIAMQLRAGDENLRAILEPVNDRQTFLCLRAEREFLRLLQSDCNAPVGVLAKIDGDRMKLRAQFFEPGAAAPLQAEVEGAPDDGERLAATLLERLRSSATKTE
jgi:hydroxymethylbilane synthase